MKSGMETELLLPIQGVTANRRTGYKRHTGARFAGFCLVAVVGGWKVTGERKKNRKENYFPKLANGEPFGVVAVVCHPSLSNRGVAACNCFWYKNTYHGGGGGWWY